MSPGPPDFPCLLQGPLLGASSPWPLPLWAWVCDLRPRFLPKGVVGTGYRAVARNGRVLLCSDRPMAELIGRLARVRLQTWHRTFLSGDVPQPWGVLLCVRSPDGLSGPTAGAAPCYHTRLVRPAEQQGELFLTLGGGLVLEFRDL
jgi:hypothetical protein